MIDSFVVVFGKEDCKACNMAKDFLTDHQIEHVYMHFKDADVALRRRLSRQFKEQNLPVSYPIILIPEGEGYTTFFGFSKKMLEQKLVK